MRLDADPKEGTVGFSVSKIGCIGDTIWILKLQRYVESLKDLQRAVELDPTLEPALKPLIEEAKNKSGY